MVVDCIDVGVVGENDQVMSQCYERPGMNMNGERVMARRGVWYVNTE